MQYCCIIRWLAKTSGLILIVNLLTLLFSESYPSVDGLNGQLFSPSNSLESEIIERSDRKHLDLTRLQSNDKEKQRRSSKQLTNLLLLEMETMKLVLNSTSTSGSYRDVVRKSSDVS